MLWQHTCSGLNDMDGPWAEKVRLDRGCASSVTTVTLPVSACV